MATSDSPTARPASSDQREVGGAEGCRERAVDQRAADDEVDVVEPVLEHRDGRRDRQGREREQAADEREVGGDAAQQHRAPEPEADDGGGVGEPLELEPLDAARPAHPHREPERGQQQRGQREQIGDRRQSAHEVGVDADRIGEAGADRLRVQRVRHRRERDAGADEPAGVPPARREEMPVREEQDQERGEPEVDRRSPASRRARPSTRRRAAGRARCSRSGLRRRRRRA